MNKFFRKGAFLFLTMSIFGAVATGCSDDDQTIAPPPEVEIPAAQITGIVTAISGDAIANAEVTAVLGNLTLTAKTNNEGIYLFEKVETAGTYELKATAAGKLPESGTVTVKAGEHGIWNAQLPNEPVKVTASATEEVTANVETETIKGNEEAVVTTEMSIPAGAVEEEVEIFITPVYTTEQAETADTRALTAKDHKIMGIALSCSKAGVTLKKPIELQFDLSEEVIKLVKAMKFLNGEWVEVKSTSKGGILSVEADAFAVYSLFIQGEIKVSDAKDVVLDSKNDNRYGSKDIQIGSLSYTYKIGSEISVKATSKLEAFLLEILARELNGILTKEVRGEYDVNVTIPVGYGLDIVGTQAAKVLTITSESKSVSGKLFGNVTFTSHLYSQEHTGGSN